MHWCCVTRLASEIEHQNRALTITLHAGLSCCVVCVMQRRQGGRDLVFQTAERSSARQEMDETPKSGAETSKSAGGEIEAKAKAHLQGNCLVCCTLSRLHQGTITAKTGSNVRPFNHTLLGIKAACSNAPRRSNLGFYTALLAAGSG